jgi:hypothetical protein
MPCPLFLPGSLLPFSDMFSGACSADPSAELSTDKLIRCCNPGYARSCCEYAADLPADSNRFLIRSCDSGSVEIAWATEFNHHPLAVGTLTIPRAALSARQASAAPEPLEYQARACALAYLHQTGQI